MNSDYINKMNRLIELVRNSPQENETTREIAEYANELKRELVLLGLSISKEREKTRVLLSALTIALGRQSDD